MTTGTTNAAGIGSQTQTTVGTITTGVWEGTVVGSAYGGTGVDNGASTFTIGGNFAMSGAHTFVGTLTGNTTVTFPTSGTLLTSASAVTSITGTANEITASASTGSITLSVPSTFIAPGTIAATTSVSAPEYLLTGSGSGTISILPQAAAGTYNFNLPITAGTSGYLLTSGGGSGAAMTWTNPASIGGVTSIAGTTNEIAASASTGAITLSIPSTFIAPGTIAATTSVSAPEYLLTGTTGVISILPQTAAGTYNFNLPTTAGTSGYLLASGGGSGSPMTWNNIASIAVSAIAGTSNEITASASTGSVTLSIPSTFIAPGTIAATTSVSSPEYLVTGSSSGTITIIGQAAAGTYNFNLPITAGTSGYVLTSAGGASSPMTWTSLGSSTVTSIAGTANEITASASTGAVTLSIPSNFIAPGTIEVGNLELTSNSLESTNTNGNIYLTPNGSGINILLNAQVTGLTASNVVLTDASKNLVSAATLSLTLGGTNADLTASNGGIFYSTASAGAILAGTATAGQLLISGASTTPAWTTSTYPATNAVNTLLYASSANVMAALATADNGTLITSNSGVPSWLANGTTGQVLTATTGSPPSWAAAAGGGGSANTLSVTQVAHGFSVGQAVYYNGTAYALAKADTAADAEGIGVVSTVTSSSVFVVTTSGYIPSSAGITGLTAGYVHWLSDGTAGLLTTTQPSTVGHIQKPMLVADSTESGFVINYRGEIIPASSTQVSWTGISSNTNLAVNTGYYITGGGALTLTLPVTAAAGTVIWVQGYGSTSWSIAQNSGQNIYCGNTATTTGTGGSVASGTAYDGIYLLCVVASTTWISTQFQGFLTVT